MKRVYSVETKAALIKALRNAIKAIEKDHVADPGDSGIVACVLRSIAELAEQEHDRQQVGWDFVDYANGTYGPQPLFERLSKGIPELQEVDSEEEVESITLETATA
jgi:hypothetical protein